MNMILHITRRADWADAQAQGFYVTPSLESEGFIHCSTAGQVVRVANSVFPGQEDLILLQIDRDKLTAPIKFEAPVHIPGTAPKTTDGELFPHIYGKINLDAVIGIIDFPPNADGTFTLPPSIDA